MLDVLSLQNVKNISLKMKKIFGIFSPPEEGPKAHRATV